MEDGGQVHRSGLLLALPGAQSLHAHEFVYADGARDETGH